ncbi:MAG: CPBP family intramembrane glutamic endopeptidase [Haliea sp.]
MTTNDPAAFSGFTFLRHPAARMTATIVILALAIVPWLPFPWRIPLVAVLALLLVRLETGSLAPAGLAPASWKQTFAWGIGTTVFCLVVISHGITPLVEWLFDIKADYSGYGALEGNLPATAVLLGKAMISAAVGEEVVYRGFLLHQLRKLFGESRIGLWAAILLGSAIFALPHHEQDIAGILSVFLAGVLLGWVFIRSGRNLWAVMLAHALIDTWGITMLYLGWW